MGACVNSCGKGDSGGIKESWCPLGREAGLGYRPDHDELLGAEMHAGIPFSKLRLKIY